MNPIALLGIFLLFFIGLAMFCKVPVAYSIGSATLAVVVAAGMKSSTICTVAFSGLDSFPLLAVPLFIFAGAIMQHSGIAHALVDLIQSIVGRLRGSLGAVTILTSAAFGILTGSCMATISCIGGIMIPEMKKKGYSDAYCSALAAASSFLGILIPPSGPLILYSITAGGVSVAALFMGGYLPGILMGLCVAGLAVFIAVKKGYKSSDVKDPDPAIKIIIDAVPSLLAVIIVMGGILAGFFTATEAGVVLCLYCGLLAILYKEMTFKSFYELLADTMESSATILFLIAASSIMSYVMSYSGIPAAISNALMSVSSNRYVILLIMNVFLLVMGMFLDLTPAVLIFTPIFLPITRSIGMSDVQFGIMLIMNLGIGSVTPPVGSCLFVGCGVGKVKIEGVTKYIVPLFAAMVVALFLVTFIPAIALVVPYLCGLVPSLGWTM